MSCEFPDAEDGVIAPEIEEQVMLNEFQALLGRLSFSVGASVGSFELALEQAGAGVSRVAVVPWATYENLSSFVIA